MNFARIITLNGRQYRLELDYYDGSITPGIESRDYLVSVACWIKSVGKVDAKIFPMTKEGALEFINKDDNQFVINFGKKMAKLEQAAMNEGLISIPVIDPTTLH